MEIYKEDVFDLLGADRDCKLDVRENQKLGFFVKDLSEYDCNDAKELSKKLETGNDSRRVGVTDLNAHSSRSHA